MRVTETRTNGSNSQPLPRDTAKAVNAALTYLPRKPQSAAKLSEHSFSKDHPKTAADRLKELR